MTAYRAAILPGPRGPFTIIELNAAQQQSLSPAERERMARCFKQRHRNLPVVFVAASPGTLHAIHGFEVTDDLRQCLQSQAEATLPWTSFEHQPATSV